MIFLSFLLTFNSMWLSVYLFICLSVSLSVSVCLCNFDGILDAFMKFLSTWDSLTPFSQ